MLNISIILPEKYRGGTLRGALNIAKMLKIGANERGHELTLNFGYVDDPNIYGEDDFYEIKKLGIKVRSFKNEVIDSKEINPIIFKWLKHRKTNKTVGGSYVSFNDGISNFEESDFWVIVSDRLSYPIPPHRKYAVVVYDYIQRYVPEIFGLDDGSKGNWLHFEQYADAARNASFVICTTEQTRNDCVNYIGVENHKVIKFPQEFDPIGQDIDFSDNKNLQCADVPYILWTTNSTQHKNHINIIRGLNKFFEKNTDIELNIHMSGVYTHLFDNAGNLDPHFNDPYAVLIRSEIKNSLYLKPRLKVLGNIPDVEYKRQLSKAEWLLHGALYDNGTFSIIEAAWVGVPVISSDYPAIRECCDNFNLSVVLFDPHSYWDLFDKITENYTKRKKWVEKIPGKAVLTKNTFSAVAPKYWDLFYKTYLNLGCENE